MPPSPPPAPRDEDGFSEREFYRREFRGRTLAVTLPRAYEGEAQRLVPVVQELCDAGARVVVIAHRASPAAELLGAEALTESTPRFEAEVWRRLVARGRVVVALGPFARFPEGCRDVAVRLGVFKLVWLDRAGGFVDADRRAPLLRPPGRALGAAGGVDGGAPTIRARASGARWRARSAPACPR